MAYYATTDFNNDDFSYSSGSSITSTKKQQKKMLDDLKRQDPGYFTIYRKNKSNKRTKLELYKTPYTPNLRIRNAITGIYENARVGSFESELHFKVALCTDENGQNPAHLYFDNPGQYELYFGVVVSNDIKQEWQHHYMLECDAQLEKKNNKLDMVIR